MNQITPMRYEVVCDRPGRLRVRFGRVAFTADEGYGIADELMRLPGVTSVTTAPANGSVLVLYDASLATCRGEVLAALGGFDRHNLPVAKPSDSQRTREIDNSFVRTLATTVGAHWARRLLLPAPIRNIYNVVRYIGFLRKGLSHLLRGDLSVEVLDAAAITAALSRGSYDSAGSIMLLLTISSELEDYTHSRSRMALEQSLALNVEDVWLVSDGADVQVPLSKVREGDSVRIRTGSMIPVDGTVISGEAAVDEASMTGESKLVIKQEGATVFAGTVVEDGNIVVCVRKTGADTRISNIVKMVDESEKLKAGAQSRAERLADAIVPYSFIAFFAILALTRNITKAMAVLMVDYSCAIKLSTPVAVMSAMREAANMGMVIKGGRYLEELAEADTIVFDKTGTLTTATPAVEKILCFGSMSQDEVLKLAACLEEHFPHSMARAVVETARERAIVHPAENHSEVSYIVAHGIVSGYEGKKVALGSSHFIFEDEGVKMPADLKDRILEEAPGCSVIYLAVDGELQGALCITDPVRLEAAHTIARLRKAGFRHIVMLTGDAENAASVVANKLGIFEYRSQVLPQDKAAIVNEYKEAGHKVVMVGDGVNDSPALAAADVSVAMIDASDIAREVADVTLLDPSLDAILTLREMSTRLMSRINRNYRIIVVFNTALIAAGVAGVLQPTTSAFMHNVSTMLITASNMTKLLPQGN